LQGSNDLEDILNKKEENSALATQKIT
jgi:hypothetical protein